MYISRICKKSFPTTKRRERLRYLIRKRFAKIMQTSTDKTIASHHHDPNNVSMTSQHARANADTDVNTTIQLRQCTSAAATSDINLGYASYDKRNKKSHTMYAKQFNSWPKYVDSKLFVSSASNDDKTCAENMENLWVPNHSSISPFSWDCDLCESPCKSQFEVENHLKEVHKETKFVYDRCRACDITKIEAQACPVFISLRALSQHVLECHQPDTANYICNTCSMAFGHKISLNIHMHFSHGEGRKGIKYSGRVA